MGHRGLITELDLCREPMVKFIKRRMVAVHGYYYLLEERQHCIASVALVLQYGCLAPMVTSVYRTMAGLRLLLFLPVLPTHSIVAIL